MTGFFKADTTMDLYAQAGYDLYSSINFVVFLTENMRQKTDNTYTQIMQRMRWGKLTDADVRLLNTRVGKTVPQPRHEASNRFFYRPIVSAMNRPRCAINVTLLHQVAARHGMTIYRFEAEPASSRTRMSGLRHLDEYLTDRLPMTFDFVLGMPVIMTRRHPLLNKADIIANGTLAFIVGFDYNSQDQTWEHKSEGDVDIHVLHRVPDMIYIRIKKCNRVLVTGFPIGIIGIPKYKYQAKITAANPNNHSATWTVTVTTFNMVPAFAGTPENLQGRTLTDGIVMTELTRGSKPMPSQALYVSFSRIQKLTDLVLLKPLSRKYLDKFRPRRETIEEMRRLQDMIEIPENAPYAEVEKFNAWIKEQRAYADCK